MVYNVETEYAEQDLIRGLVNALRFLTTSVREQGE